MTHAAANSRPIRKIAPMNRRPQPSEKPQLKIPMKHALAALILLAAASQALARITDNFLDDQLEGNFRRNLIRELARQDIPISNEMIGGAFQFCEDLPTNTVTIKVHGTNDKNETLYSIPIPGNHIEFYNNFPNCPETIHCRFYFFQKKGEKPRAAFLKGDTFLIDELDVELDKSGNFSHYFGLSEAERTPEGIKPIPGQKGKTYIDCLSPIRLKQWSLTVGFNNYIYPFFTKEKKEILARAPLPEVPRAGGGGEKKGEGKTGAGKGK